MDTRVVYFSRNDLFCGYYLEKAEKVLNSNINKNLNILDYIEFYNINLYFENGVYLRKRDKNTINLYSEKANNLNKLAIQYFKNINDSNILDIIKKLKDSRENKLALNYEESFVCIMDKFKIYKNISGEILLNILNITEYYIYFFLLHKNISKYYETEFKQFLISYRETGKMFLDFKNNRKNYFFPYFEMSEKNIIINKYLDLHQNENIFNESIEIYQLKNDDFLKIDDEIRVKAKKIYDKLKQDTKKLYTTKFYISYLEDDILPERKVIQKGNELICEFKCSLNELESHDYTLDPFGIFKDQFKFINKRGLIDLVAKDSKASQIEKLVFHSTKDDYNVNIIFYLYEQLTFLNLKNFEKTILTNKNETIENLINRSIQLLGDNDPFKGMTLNLVKLNGSAQDGIIMLAPKIDSLVKQYICGKKKGHIDMDYINTIKTISYESVPSLMSSKYYYCDNEEIKNIAGIMFSRDSQLAYSHQLGKAFSSFYALIMENNLTIDDFETYQRPVINVLIEKGYLVKNSNKIIIPGDISTMIILKDLYEYGELFFNFYGSEEKNKILEFYNNGDFSFGSTLLSKNEANYFDYYLNDHKFSNGLKIRNKNIHGYIYEDEFDAEKEYYIFLWLMILLILKIQQEISILNINESIRKN